MDEILLKKIQDWVNGVPLIVLGSGASIPFDLPSMWSLGQHLKKSISFTDDARTSQFNDFKAKLDENGDLEQALQEANLEQSITQEIVFKTWQFILESDEDAYRKLVEDKRDFPLMKLFWHLTDTSDEHVSVVTTNYDRLAEYAASISGSFAFTGFQPGYIGRFLSEKDNLKLRKQKAFRGQVDIMKVHGSLDWFKDENNDIKSLPNISYLPKGYMPAIITPGVSKYEEAHLEPYRTIIQKADEAISNASSFLCIGYGFNDKHIQPKLISALRKGVPIIVLTKKLTEKTWQNILGNNCENYVLIEKGERDNTTKLWTHGADPFIVEKSSYWELGKFISLIVP